MSVISSDLETLAADPGPDKTRQRRSRQSSRRKRSLRWMIRRHLGKMLRSRQTYRAGVGVLILVGFIHVSLKNNVLGPEVLGPEVVVTDSITSVRRAVNSDVTGSEAETLKLSRIDPDPTDERLAVAPAKALPTVSAMPSTNARAKDTMTPPVSALSIRDFRSLRLLSGQSAEIEDVPSDFTKVEPLVADIAATRRSVGKTTTYVVNEGGSLWRTVKRFIDDEVLLDKLIDNLAENGMDVRSVRAGMEFIVNDLGSEGLLVVVDDDGDTYESRILKDRVTTTVQRRPVIGIDSTSRASLDY